MNTQVKLHGCHNGPDFVETLVVQDGWNYDMTTLTRTPRMVVIPNANSKDCQYTKSSPDDKSCTGCLHKNNA